MKLQTAIKRSLATTRKQIFRSGWLATASVMVMILAFFISTIFVVLAYTSNLFLQSIENKPHIYVFFYPGTKESEIMQLKNEWQDMPEIDRLDYTSEVQAVEEFRSVQIKTNPTVAEGIRDDVLPASLEFRLKRISDAEKVISIVEAEHENNDNIFAVRFSKETIDTLRTLFTWLRIGGGIVMGLLLIVIFSFTLLTVEFRTFSRSEEIGIMQLVGGSLWFIRSPFILEGAFYGFLGAFISSTIIYILAYVIFIVNQDSNAVKFIVNLFSGLNWPALEGYHFALIFIGMIILGAVVGAANSMIAIRRYIF